MAQNLTLSLFTVLTVLLFLELFFKVFFAQSDAINATLASQNWFNRYWQLNSSGYRDVEWSPELLARKTRVMVLGDSFVAGHGIKKPQDRFSDVLGQMLGENYAVMNVGQNGANTTTEIYNGLKYPYEPDILVLSFYIDDILDTARGLGYDWDFVAEKNNPSFLIEESYALNFIFWRIYRPYLYQPRPDQNTGASQNFMDWLLELYDNPDIKAAYREELLKIYTYAQEKDIQLIVVVFPHLTAVEISRPITSEVIHLYEEQGIPVLDVSIMIEGMPANSLVVNQFDAHPNELVHRLVAEELYRIISNAQLQADN